MAFYNSELYWAGFGTAMACFFIAVGIVWRSLRYSKKQSKGDKKSE